VTSRTRLCRLLSSVVIILLWFCPALADSRSDGHNELSPIVLIGIAFVLLIGKVGSEIFERLRQPAVLGELVAGVLFGSLALVGFNAIESLKTDSVIAALAQIGVIILLFEVGLETNLTEMKEVGWSSMLVALAGVVAPFFLGWIVARYFLPDESNLAHIFVGATLCAVDLPESKRRGIRQLESMHCDVNLVFDLRSLHNLKLERLHVRHIDRRIEHFRHHAISQRKPHLRRKRV